MRTHKVLAAGAAVLALGIVFLAAGQAADDKGPREDVDKLAGVAAKSPDDLQKKADAFAKNLDSLEDVMNLFKKRTKDPKNPGGYGIGKVATNAPDDGIEARIQNYGKKSPTGPQLKKDKDDLIEMVNRTKAIAAITIAKTPKKKEGDKDPKDWKEYSEEMVKQADALGKAIEAADPKAVKDAASKLNGSCTNCHGKFRD
jgi:soluble cytochrome b562